MSERYSGWAAGPSRVERPNDLAGVCEVVRAANGESAPILPCGAGLALSVGGRPGPTQILLDLGGLSRIVRILPEDLTVTVQAGVPLTALHAALAEAGLELPGAPDDGGTIGGLLASGHTSSDAGVTHGSLRERVLGLTTVDGRGTPSKSGGTVVKNVTGYDLHRMHAGPGGAFGVLTEITFRLEPKPEKQRVWSRRFPELADVDAAWRRLRQEGPEVRAVRVQPAGSGVGVLAETDLFVLLAGDREVVDADASWLQRELGLTEAGELDVWVRLGLRQLAASGDSWCTVVRCAPASWAATLRALGVHAILARGGFAWEAFPELGAIRVSAPAPECEHSWREIARRSAAGQWQYRVEAEPLDSGSSLPPWSADPGAFLLLARWKAAVDPAGILRPGSYSEEALERARAFFDAGYQEAECES